RVDRNRTRERRLKPGGKIRSQSRKIKWPVATRRTSGVEIAVREFTGESAEHGDAQSINVGGLIARFAREHFGRYIGGCAGNVLGRKFFQPRHANHPEIDQL